MTKKILFLITLIGSIAFATGNAQTSAQASMKASVRIVKAAGIQFESISFIHLNQTNKSNFYIGYVRMKGLENSAVYVQNNLEVKDLYGEKMKLKVLAKTENAGDGEAIRLVGSLPDYLPLNGFYSGDLAITIEHL